MIGRSRRWRSLRALRVFLGGVLLAPVVFFVPPHAPWAIGAMAGGAFLAHRRFRERVSLLRAEGSCPRCETSLRVSGPVRLRNPHPVPCEACGHEPALHVDVEPEASAQEAG